MSLNRPSPGRGKEKPAGASEVKLDLGDDYGGKMKEKDRRAAEQQRKKELFF
jgi:hypothetical protein